MYTCLFSKQNISYNYNIFYTISNSMHMEFFCLNSGINCSIFCKCLILTMCHDRNIKFFCNIHGFDI